MEIAEASTSAFFLLFITLGVFDFLTVGPGEVTPLVGTLDTSAKKSYPGPAIQKIARVHLKRRGFPLENETAVTPSTQSSIEKLADALAKAQGEFPVIPKDSEVIVYSKDSPKRELYRYKYADLTTIISSTRPAMSKHGLSFTQGMVQGGWITTIMHASGQVLRCGFIPCEIPKSQDMKQVAGTITYVKRISLTAALGVSADEDVDAAAQESDLGNSTSKGPAQKTQAKGTAKPPAAQQKPPAKPNNNAPADQATMDRLLDLMIDRGVHEIEISKLIRDAYGIKADRPPLWVALEVGKLLENEDCNSAMIERKFKEVVERRKAAAGGKNA